ncbi:MAG TPA: porin family protein [Flavobacteriaceae bacterium]|nr:porin family protein [Flavobacteriaceae bacterium]
MKKGILLAAFAFMAFTATQAQEVRLGIKGGYNLANLTGDVGDAKARSAFHIGGLVEVPVSEQFSVQPEILYSSQGAEYTGSFTGADNSKITAKLDYIQVPVMAKFYAVDGFALEVGPQVSFLTSATGKIETTVGDVTVNHEEDLENFKKVDFGVGLGASYRIPMGVFFGARYNFGLTNLNDDSDSSAKIRNGVLQISAGYSF